jgi:5'-3' exonuclease
MKYLLVDTANLFFRARHGAMRGADAWAKLGMSLHITLMAANKVAARFGADHVVFALEGRSWRKDFYTPYKANRAVARASLTEAEKEEDALFWETYDTFTKYLSEKTNCSVIKVDNAEADDIIARWIALHPDDHHVIISSDSDFYQLIAENVDQYNGISEELITIDGIYDAKGNPVIDKKTKLAKAPPNPQWLLFEKCMRGDTSDNVFSAYPGVRTKGTLKKVGLTEAFEDKTKKGYSWNNLMLQKWMDHNGTEHRVMDDYERNRTLIDLTQQPIEIKNAVDTAIREQISHKDIGQVGVRFMQFCGKYELNKCSESAEAFGRWMNSTYNGILNDSSQASN